jgi:hypothetical protein
MNAMLVLMLLLTQTPGGVEKAKSPNESEDAVMRAAVTASSKEFAGRCEFILSAAEKKNLVLYPEPILRWSNPTAGTVLGEVFVWTDNGRPAVIGSWYRWFSPEWGSTFEVCSLSDGKVEGRTKDVRFWSPAKPGLTFKPLKNVDPPVTSHAARLVQMRRLAKEFTASLVDDRGTPRVSIGSCDCSHNLSFDTRSPVKTQNTLMALFSRLSKELTRKCSC